MFREERACEAPLNVYGYSKFLFDQHVRRMLPERTAQIAGFRYFNVYGPREQHKGTGASVAWHFFRQYRKEGRVHLFAGSGGYADGEQRRDFVAVEDVVNVNLDFLDHPERSGIFNVGSGRAATFNAVAAATDQRVPRRGRRGAATAGASSSPTASSATSRCRRRSPASTRASPKPISRGCALPATRRRCARSTKAFRATSNG